LVETKGTWPIPGSQLSLQGKTALVVGGSSGIGNAVAHGFQDNGARVAIAARTPAKVKASTT
jgi:NAD(P)-dependent dehydrogenase (short-subunit alcohol dehydrogenase family)